MQRKEKKNRSLYAAENRIGWFAVLPPLLLLLVFECYPLVTGIVKSFTNWDGLFRNDFVGLDNYIKMFSDERFWLALSNNFLLLLFLPLQLLLGLIVAVFIYEKVPLWRFYRSCYYLPQVTSALSIGYLFATLFSSNGAINTLFRAIGLDWLAIQWFSSRGPALVVIIICMVWINIGWQGMLFLGGMSQIPPSVYEAAVLDGAGYWTRLFRITLPMLVHTVEYSCIMSVIWCFTGLFSLIFSITGGGPGYDTTTVDYMVYMRAFKGTSNYGYASALAVVLMVIVVIFTVVQMKLSKKMDDWSD